MWSDFDNDGKLDLLVANDGEPNYLYRDLGGGKFKEMGGEAGVALSEEGVEQANMGLACGDYMRAGRMSIAVSHFSDEYAELYRNDGAMNFTDVAHSAAIAKSSASYVGWGDAFVDTAEPRPARSDRGERPCLSAGRQHQARHDLSRAEAAVWNEGTASFATTGAGRPALRVPQVSRGLAVGDLFNRGKQNVVIENLTGGPMILAPKPTRRTTGILHLLGTGHRTVWR